MESNKRPENYQNSDIVGQNTGTLIKLCVPSTVNTIILFIFMISNLDSVLLRLASCHAIILIKSWGVRLCCQKFSAYYISLN